MWLTIIVIGYFLNAVAAVVDKFLISKKIPNPAVYTFYITLLGLAGLVLIPWGFNWLGWQLFLIAIIAGLTFTLALLHLFKGLSLGEASRITPFIGGLSPVFVFIFSFFFLQEKLAQNQIVALLLIILGTIFISYGRGISVNPAKAYWFAFFSALMFGLSYTLIKYIFNSASFVNGFIWIRLTTFLGGLILLFWQKNRRAIFGEKDGSDKNGAGGADGGIKKSWPLFLFGQVVGSVSFILINYAISLTSVTLVNALQGLQYIFLFAIALILYNWRPYLLEEKMRGRVLVQKFLAIIFIGLGLYLLV